MKKVAMIGSGAYGSALSAVLSDSGQQVTIYGINAEEVDEIQTQHTNSKYFGEQTLPRGIEATCDLSVALEAAEAIVLAVPSSAVQAVIQQILPQVDARTALMINVSKGLDPETQTPLSSVLQQFFDRVGALHGPSFAAELLQRCPTGLLSLSKCLGVAQEIAALFRNDAVSVSVHTDIIGAEYAAALKNSIAIMCGIVQGLYGSQNAQAMLFTLGFRDMVSFARHHGAQLNTLLTVAGVGDLYLTAASRLSRNFLLGQEIGQRDQAKTVLARAGETTVEGIGTCHTVYKVIQKAGLHLPVMKALYDILFNHRKPSAVVRQLCHTDHCLDA